MIELFLAGCELGLNEDGLPKHTFLRSLVLGHIYKNSQHVLATLNSCPEVFFCSVHHLDIFPPGTSGSEKLGVDPKLLRGRNLGSDFVVRDGFRMYHGSVVPGFPSHPHRGFETVTIARQGFIDHSDSLGARGNHRQED